MGGIEMNEEVDVSECIFRVLENDELIWEGENYSHAFFLKSINPKARKVTVNAKIDVTLEGAEDFMQSMKEPE